MSSTLLDVTKEIKLDHDNVRDLFDRFTAATDLTEKASLAHTLVREMAVHGDAEERSVYLDYSILGLAADHNKEDHAEIERLVDAAGKTAVDKPEFAAVIARAVTTFLTHCKEEEDEQHPVMRQKLSPQDSDKLARAFLKARSKVSARSNASALQTASFAPLRFAHPQI
ncbi:uncharacterized protein TRAVEDRAFT_141682 [Trametes versicolor FP-101664 SS1]|uniref:uncharacterized protein n=1 Tax=Trametes versicolor (strain FP-101664) TaxID=717944 RepID=UPI0004622A42|nr:uncharacterized protein TRAVEDRAFT_141682 [Trametes versicolor FP-101664 SS1]EIW63044.1 hypothetical protein TRAVEDRAFT_141682 [Trametes versicolor FP-101664 SS1]